MAVYTALTQEEIGQFIGRYDVGDFVSAEGITEGVENTNYLIETRQNRYILTLFEQRTRPEDLPYFVHLMQWFSARGIPCPLPVARKDGGVLAALKEKPAMLATFLEGQGVTSIRNEHLPQLGTLAANMHIAGMDFPHQRENVLSLSGWGSLVERIDGAADNIDPGLNDLIAEEYRYISEHWPSGLPSGPIHADLFPDNIFFQRLRGSPKLSGVIDFYFSCNDMWAYDLAVCVNAWCFDDRHRFLPERVQALLAAYNDIRPMSDEEGRAMPVLLRGAALRFLLTRVFDWVNTPPSAHVVKKDPMEYVEKLKFHQESSSGLYEKTR